MIANSNVFFFLPHIYFWIRKTCFALACNKCKEIKVTSFQFNLEPLLNYQQGGFRVLICFVFLMGVRGEMDCCCCSFIYCFFKVLFCFLCGVFKCFLLLIFLGGGGYFVGVVVLLLLFYNVFIVLTINFYSGTSKIHTGNGAKQ